MNPKNADDLAPARRMAELERRCAALDARVVQLQELLQRRTELLERKQEVISQNRAIVAAKTQAVQAARSRYEALRDRLTACEADKGVLAQTYYDQYFAKREQTQHLRSAVAHLEEQLAGWPGQQGTDGTQIGEVQSLLEQIAETDLTIPSLRPYPRLGVDLGIRDGCDEFCHRFRRALLTRMPTAFNTRVMAILDLAEHADAAAYEEAVRAASKGNTIREARKAADAGLVCRPFDPAEHVDDIDAILASKPERQGGALRPPYDEGAEAFLAFARAEHPHREPPCPRHHTTWFGVFEPRPGATDALLGFVMLERLGDFAHFRHILGHGDRLAQGIMYHLQLSLVAWLFATGADIKVLSYAGWTELPDSVDSRPGLTRWKKKTLFRPTLLMEVLSSPPDRVLEEIVENAANKAFPHYVLDEARSAACLYSVALMGQRDVIHVQQRGLEAVTLVDHDEAMLAEMRKVYPPGWTYHAGDAFAWLADAHARRLTFDVVILDPWVYLEQANIDRLRQIVGITNQYVLISLTEVHFFRRNHVEPTADGVLRHFGALHHRVRAADAVLSTHHAGGLWWCVLDVRDA